ncbi:MAG: hypothetical protein L3J50_00295 [Emcibacter sp.]|nr:hypothetical protein [Emcibacter sp.]
MNRGEGEYLVEFIQVGSYMKVSAVDTVSGREVSIVGPASASRNQLSRVAVNKLKYVLAKEKS